MHFCKECGNMYYLKISDEEADKIMYFCRKCGDKDDTIINSQEIVFVYQKLILKKPRKYIKILLMSIQNLIQPYPELVI